MKHELNHKKMSTCLKLLQFKWLIQIHIILHEYNKNVPDTLDAVSLKVPYIIAFGSVKKSTIFGKV